MTDAFRAASGATIHAVIDRRAIEAAQKRIDAEGGRATLADSVATGLRLVLGARSARWTYAYRPRGVGQDGKRLAQRTLAIGDLSNMSPAAARIRVDELKAAIRRGEDPAADLRAAAEVEKLTRTRASTVAELAADYMAGKLSKNTRHHSGQRAYLRLAIEEMGLGAVGPEHITRARLADLMDLHRDRPATARHRLGAISRFISWMITREIVSTNPAKLLDPTDRPSTVPTREHVLTASDIAALWIAAVQLPEVRRDFLRAALCVPLRRAELAELRVGEVDLGAGNIRLPGSKVKNGRSFEISIPAVAMPIFQARCAAAEPTDRVFPLSSVNTPMTAWSKYLATVRKLSGVAEFAFHDTRRTFVTRLGDTGIADAWLLDGMLNHAAAATRRGVISRYQHAPQLEARRQVIRAWSRQLEHAIETGEWPKAPDNVVTLNARSVA